MSRTIFTVGKCKVIGGFGRLDDGTTIRSLTVAQYKAAKVLLLTLGLDHDELDDLRSQLCEERQHQDRLRQMRRHEPVANHSPKPIPAKALDAYLERIIKTLNTGNSQAVPEGWDRV